MAIENHALCEIMKNGIRISDFVFSDLINDTAFSNDDINMLVV